ncbi:hypothetical protein D3C86_1539950 [compost metagenome]
MKMTGRSAWRSINAAQVEKPSIPGMSTSSSTASGENCASAPSAALPLAAVCTSMASPPSARVRKLRASALSSTTSTRVSDAANSGSGCMERLAKSIIQCGTIGARQRQHLPRPRADGAAAGGKFRQLRLQGA